MMRTRHVKTVSHPTQLAEGTLLNIRQAAKLVIANTIALSSETSLLTSSVVFVVMLAIWLEIVLTDSVEPTGATMRQEHLQVAQLVE